MRVHMKRLGLLAVGGLTMTVLLLLLPNQIEEKLVENPENLAHNAKGTAAPIPHAAHDSFQENNMENSEVLVESLRKRLVQYERLQPGYPPQQEAFQKKDPEGLFKPVIIRKLNHTIISGLQTALKPWEGIDAAPLECSHNETLGEYWLRKNNAAWPTVDSWDRFHSQIGSCDMYRPDSPEVKELLHDMATMPVKHVAIMDGGTQVKLLITFENGKQAVFKPMRFNRHYESDPNHFYFSDFERHHAELGSYHLDKVLGIRHTVPLVGRVFNISSELLQKAEKALAKTFFVSPVGNQCFVSKCDYYCDTTHAICGSPDLKEGSLQVFLPDDEVVPRDHNRSPYRRTYSKKNQLAQWQWDLSYCRVKVKRKAEFAHGRRLLDLVELHIFDFLTGNQDRHHFETWDVFEDFESYVIYLDNGRGFGHPSFEDMTILAPLNQCCVIRPTLLKTLLRFYSGPQTLSEALYESMEEDPVAPILSPKHYPALERRLTLILQTVLKCIQRKQGDATQVIMTEFHNPMIPVGGGDKDKEDTEEKENGDPNPPHPHGAPHNLKKVITRNNVKVVKHKRKR